MVHTVHCVPPYHPAIQCVYTHCQHKSIITSNKRLVADANTKIGQVANCHSLFPLQRSHVTHSRILRMAGSGSLEPRWARVPPTAAILDSSLSAREPECARAVESGQEKNHSANVNYYLIFTITYSICIY